MVLIQEETVKNPITLIGKEAGVCYGSNVLDDEKNYLRGCSCIKANHGRTLEFPQVYMVLDGYSARVIREFYTHISGSPTRLQSSTRYIDYEKGFDYIVPKTVMNDVNAADTYDKCIEDILSAMKKLEELNIPREDIAMLLPLGMTTKIVVRTNLRNLVDMSRQRMCSRAYWEYRDLMQDICTALKSYSDEWTTIVDNLFKPKCDDIGYCTEEKCCGRHKQKKAGVK